MRVLSGDKNLAFWSCILKIVVICIIIIVNGTYEGLMYVLIFSYEHMDVILFAFTYYFIFFFLCMWIQHKICLLSGNFNLNAPEQSVTRNLVISLFLFQQAKQSCYNNSECSTITISCLAIHPTSSNRHWYR